MKTIPLSQGFVAFVDDEDYDRVNQFKWCVTINIYGSMYAVRSYRTNGVKRTCQMHRFIMGKESQIDHINRNGLDNQKQNLRFATTLQNGGNSKKHSNGKTSRFKGVSFMKRYNKWRTHVSKKYIGWFDSEEDAAMAYNESAKHRWGEFALLNQL